MYNATLIEVLTSLILSYLSYYTVFYMFPNNYFVLLVSLVNEFTVCNDYSVTTVF